MIATATPSTIARSGEGRHVRAIGFRLSVFGLLVNRAGNTLSSAP
jgi:hypothetical protein